MQKVSILMSIYNETIEYVEESLNSLLNQSYQNIEIVIVIDNPKESNKYMNFLENYKNLDNVIVLANDFNVGLALSMNKAFMHSSGELIARMDSDDISENDRIQKEVDEINKYNLDCVFSGFSYIDENGEKINKKYIYIPEEKIPSILITTNCIHHPTVMMTRKIFEKVNGYRDFPCSQDYDLWLRFLDLGCKFSMINEKLLQYRVRESSTTSRKRFEQACTLFYISSLYYERLCKSRDTYSKQNYELFMSKCKKKYKKHEENILKIQKWQSKLGENQISSIFWRVFLLFYSNFIRDSYLLKLKIKLKTKSLNK